MKRPFPISTIKSISKNNLTANEKLVLILLMDWQEKCEVFISAAKIAEQASLGEATVKRVFKSLTSKEILTLKKQRRGQTYIYVKKLNFEKLKKLTPTQTGGSNQSENDLSISDDFHF